MTQPIISPFRWAENPRPSIFGTDPHFTTKKRGATPTSASQIVVARTAGVNAIKSVRGKGGKS